MSEYLGIRHQRLERNCSYAMHFFSDRRALKWGLVKGPSSILKSGRAVASHLQLWGERTNEPDERV